MTEIKYNHLNWPICECCKYWDFWNAKSDIFSTLYAKCKLRKETTSETNSCEKWEHYKEEETN